MWQQNIVTPRSADVITAIRVSTLGGCCLHIDIISGHHSSAHVNEQRSFQIAYRIKLSTGLEWDVEDQKRVLCTLEISTV